jgi:hypothetical protein
MQQARLNAGQEGHYGLHEVCNIQSYELNMFRAHSSVRRSSSGQRITGYSERKKSLGFNFRRCQLHALAALPPAKEPLVPIE